MGDTVVLDAAKSEFCTLTDAAEFLQLSEGAVLAFAVAGRLPIAAARPRRFRRSDVEALRQTLDGPAPSPPAR